MMPQIVRDPERELAADWDLFQAVESGSAVLRWRCWELEEPVVVIGCHGSIDRELFADACAADRVPVVQRVSGGGAVVLGRGCLNYAIAIPLEAWPDLADIKESYTLILEAIVTRMDVAGLMIDGGADLSLYGRKVSGNAQRRGRRAILHHGTLLYDFDAALATRYLRAPARQPSYRRARTHEEFMGNLPLTGDVVRARFESACRSLADKRDNEAGRAGGAGEAGKAGKAGWRVGSASGPPHVGAELAPPD